MTGITPRLGHASALFPPLHSDVAAQLQVRLPADLQAPFGAFWRAIQQAGDVYNAMIVDVRDVWTQEARLSSKAKHRRSARLMAQHFQAQQQALDQGAQALQNLRTLVQDRLGTPPDEITDAGRLALVLTRMLERCQGLLDQAQLSRAAALKHNLL
ncbi:hypothetical protein [uncultured Deinococcus sp.]|uniref:hypothetical protein n=1 Tax=uncultured Deinococcus sp. TaxID=158789 RepID=UPI00258DC300|nr:hypothetical protein [uncultured Deinococcus sp.]